MSRMLVSLGCAAALVGCQTLPLASLVAADQILIPDKTFGDGGYVADHLDVTGTTDDAFRNFAVDKEGRAVGAGNTAGQRFVLARYTTAGLPDKSFGQMGKATVCLEPEAIVAKAPENDHDRIQFTHGITIDSKGRIVLIGKSSSDVPKSVTDCAILRFTPAGSLDTTFHQTGYKKFAADDRRNTGIAIAAAADSALVAAAYSHRGGLSRDPLLIRLSEDGTIDDAFSLLAKLSLRAAIPDLAPTLATAVAIDKQGRFVVGLVIQKDGKSSWGVARVTPEGSLDADFATAGLWTSPLDPSASNEGCYSVGVDDAGRIVVGGYSADGDAFRCLAVARFDDRGQLDASFGPDGKGFVILGDYGAKLTNIYGPRAAISKGRIAITGAIAGTGGKGHAFGVAVLEGDGKQIAKAAAQRFPGSGGTDLPWGVGFDPQGRILIGGTSIGTNGKKRFALARYTIQ